MNSLEEAKKRKPKELRIHCDEAGRGPLAGPVTVGCSVLLAPTDVHLFKDSKQLTKYQREQLYTQAKSHTLSLEDTDAPLVTATGRASAKEIDSYGIISAVQLACRRGIGVLLQTYYMCILRNQLLESDFGEDILVVRRYDMLFAQPIDENTVLYFQQLPNSYASIPGLIRDGTHTFGLETLLDIPVVTIIKGDQKHPLISLSSIVAKVERDRYMQEMSVSFPDYCFEKHHGYGTKLHRDLLMTHGLSSLHRTSFCKNMFPSASMVRLPLPKVRKHALPHFIKKQEKNFSKPRLLLHICCAPDLSRPLLWLKDHFKLALFRYNPNIHPRKEHEQRYSQFLKLVGLEPGDYEILEDRYDPKEFFQAMVDQKETIDPVLKSASEKEVLKKAGDMKERSDRCNPCYSMRLEMAARMAAKESIPYFTSTLLISPKKKMDKLFRRGKESELRYPTTKFLWFDFPKNGGYEKANHITRKHNLWRQNYCGCGRTIPKPGEKVKSYQGG